jgi:hypothetical protein
MYAHLRTGLFQPVWACVDLVKVSDDLKQDCAYLMQAYEALALDSNCHWSVITSYLSVFTWCRPVSSWSGLMLTC